VDSEYDISEVPHSYVYNASKIGDSFSNLLGKVSASGDLLKSHAGCFVNGRRDFAVIEHLLFTMLESLKSIRAPGDARRIEGLSTK